MTTRTRTQELKVVFTAGRLGEPQQIGGKASNISLHSYKGAVAPLDALELIVKTMNQLGIDTTFMRNGGTVSAERLLEGVGRKGRWQGHLETKELYFQYGVVAAYELSFVSVQEIIPGAAGDWNLWADAFTGQTGFVQGWLADAEYNHWQNAKDPLQYDVARRDFSHLPTRSNGLPPPLESLEIDISRNPGRWEFRSGYIDVVGATMWLGEIFWSRVGRNQRDHAISSDWLKVSEAESGTLKVQAADNCFDSDRTSEIQDWLRKLLFG